MPTRSLLPLVAIIVVLVVVLARRRGVRLSLEDLPAPQFLRKFLVFMTRSLLHMLLAILGLTLAWMLFFSIVLFLVEDIGFFASLKWIFVEIFGLQLPGLPDVRSNLGHVILAFSGTLGPIIIALLVGFVADRVIELTQGRQEGRTTSARDLGFDGHIVLVGWNETTATVMREIIEAGEEGSRLLGSSHSPGSLEFFVIGMEGRSSASEIRSSIADLLNEPTLARYRDRVRYEVAIGDPNSYGVLHRAAVEKARAVVIALGDDNDTLYAMVSVNHYLEKTRCKARDPIVIAVEVLEDENESIFRGAIRAEGKAGGCPREFRIILSRAYAGRILASALTEPYSVHALLDLITYKEGQLDVLRDPSREEQEAENVEMRPFIIVEPDGTRRLANPNDTCEDTTTGSEYSLICIRHRRSGQQARPPFGAYKDPAVLERLNRLRSYETRGHVNIIGFTEATESMIKELSEKRRLALEKKLEEETYAATRTIIVASQRNIMEELDPQAIGTLIGPDSIIHVKGDPLKMNTLRRIGLLSSAAIVVSMNRDERALRVVLNVSWILKQWKHNTRHDQQPIILVETLARETLERLLDIQAADFGIASRTLAGQLITYAILDKRVYEAIEDLISSTEGRFDLRQLTLTKKLATTILSQAPPNEGVKASTLDNALYQYDPGRTIPRSRLLAYKPPESHRIIYLPEPDTTIPYGSEIIILAERGTPIETAKEWGPMLATVRR